MAYHGSRLMTKEDLYLLMYEDQIPVSPRAGANIKLKLILPALHGMIF